MKKLTFLYPATLLMAFVLFAASCKKTDSNPTRYRITKVSDNETEVGIFPYINTYVITYTPDSKVSTIAYTSSDVRQLGYAKNFSYINNLTLVTTTYPLYPHNQVDSLFYSAGLLSAVSSVDSSVYTHSVYSYNLSDQLISVVDSTHHDSTSYFYTNGDITSASSVATFAVTPVVYQYTTNTYATGDYEMLLDFLKYGTARTPTAHLLRNVTSTAPLPVSVTSTTVTYVMDNASGNITQVTAVTNVDSDPNKTITHIYDLTYELY